LIFPMALS